MKGEAFGKKLPIFKSKKHSWTLFIAFPPPKYKLLTFKLFYFLMRNVKKNIKWNAKTQIRYKICRRTKFIEPAVWKSLKTQKSVGGQNSLNQEFENLSKPKNPSADKIQWTSSLKISQNPKIRRRTKVNEKPLWKSSTQWLKDCQCSNTRGFFARLAVVPCSTKNDTCMQGKLCPEKDSEHS